MKLVLLILLLLAMYVAFDLGKLFFYRNKLELVDFSREEIILGQGEELRYIAGGDSIARGEGASSIGNTYPYKIAENLSQNKKIVYKNIGVSGAQMNEFKENQLSQIIDFNPDIVTISIGANDVTHLVSEEKIYTSYQEIKGVLEEKTSATIYVASIPNFRNAKLLPFWFRRLIDKKANRINERIVELESERFKIVDIHDSIPNSPETFAADEFHPSDVGYTNWSGAFLKVLSRK